MNPDVITLRSSRGVSIKQNQFSLRSLALLVALVAIALLFRNQLTGVTLRWGVVVTLPAFLASFALARYSPLTVSKRWLVLRIPMLILMAYANFALIRLKSALTGSGPFPLSYPYPDRILTWLEICFRRPPDKTPPYSIDMHGGMIETVAIITLTAIITAILGGLSLGASATRKNA